MHVVPFTAVSFKDPVEETHHKTTSSRRAERSGRKAVWASKLSLTKFLCCGSSAGYSVLVSPW